MDTCFANLLYMRTVQNAVHLSVAWFCYALCCFITCSFREILAKATESLVWSKYLDDRPQKAPWRFWDCSSDNRSIRNVHHTAELEHFSLIPSSGNSVSIITTATTWQSGVGSISIIQHTSCVDSSILTGEFAYHSTDPILRDLTIKNVWKHFLPRFWQISTVFQFLKVLTAHCVFFRLDVENHAVCMWHTCYVALQCTFLTSSLIKPVHSSITAVVAMVVLLKVMTAWVLKLVVAVVVLVMGKLVTMILAISLFNCEYISCDQ